MSTLSWNNLILGLDERQTPAHEDPVGFNQLDLIETPGNAAGPSTTGINVKAFISQTTEQHADQLADLSTNQAADLPAEQPAA